MSFRFSDLMIHVLPSTDENLAAFGRNINANAACFLWLSVGCVFSFCPGSHTRIPISIDELAVLKVQLQQALAQVEAQEEAMNAMMRPQTVAEAQALEEKMVKALEELKHQKEELQKNAVEGQG